MTYNAEKYWHDRGVDYSVSVDTSAEVSNLIVLSKKYLEPKNTILDIGSGYGRIFQEFQKHPIIDLNNYKMCDFVQSMRYNCFRKTGRLPDYWDGKELPYYTEEFDLVISFSVFLHVPPDMLEQVFDEHCRVCKKYMFVATYAGGPEGLAKHCFSHDYEELFYNCGLGLEIIDEKYFMDGKRVNWLLKKY